MYFHIHCGYCARSASRSGLLATISSQASVSGSVPLRRNEGGAPVKIVTLASATTGISSTGLVLKSVKSV